MMAKEHKYHRSRIEIDTALDPAQVLDLARQAVGTENSLRVDGEYGDGFSVLLRNVFGIKIMHFTVHARREGERTQAVSRLQEYSTSQQTVLFIPVSPKTIDGYGTYRRFMSTLQGVIQAADPAARCSILEQEVAA